ncbi:hypothetical protein B0T21DRAFT_417472 [Apiosordaria backusii]|uniref:Trichothecene 3-O-acetyltransferase-like N-terminal domain-containing protein n=1 Tax=Apiosordaria backusii TaxID=314023 RepID=A0AA40EXA5_9PEZI|nr:hypothetical protein B0T21DRAFT_417472 [Apiosordaria backusii]
MFRTSLSRTATRAVRTFSTTATKSSSIPLRICGRGTGTKQTITIKDKPYTIQTDTYPILGGADSAPSPVAYNLASLTSCNQVTGAKVAEDHGIKLGEWNVRLDAVLPTDVLVKGKCEGNPNWESVKLFVRVQTNILESVKGDNLEADARFRHFVREVERRCPITQLFKRSGLRPKGWETDPEHEYFNLSTLDYCVGQVYTNYALFFKLSPNANKSKIISTIKDGLEVTLTQCRQLCGTLEPQPDGNGGLCFHKTKDSTVELHVQFLDTVEHELDGEYRTFEALEAQHFASRALGNMNTWCVFPMTYGEKPEAQPSSRPKCAAFKITFIQGGFVFMMHHHHYTNDVMGWAGELHQLAENCAAVWANPTAPALPPWDPSCLDLSRVTAPDVPEDKKIDGPVSPLRHPDHKKAQWLLFHLSKSKTAALKEVASPKDGSYYISSYDAYNALIWRLLTKHRFALFHNISTDPANISFLWGEAVDMRRRFSNPPIGPRTQGNVVHVALSN